MNYRKALKQSLPEGGIFIRLAGAILKSVADRLDFLDKKEGIYIIGKKPENVSKKLKKVIF